VIEAYVTVHDAALLAACEASGQFGALPRTYTFVGPRPAPAFVSPRVVVARDFDPNYEQHPSFYDFTGWFVLARHGLIAAERIVTLQYDMHVADPVGFASAALAMLDAEPGPVAFVPGHRSAGNWMLWLAGFEATFNAGMAAVGVDPGTFPPFEEWPTTQGMAWRRDELVEFMDWFEPLFGVWAGELWAGHLAERSVWAWMMATGRAPRYLHGYVVHEGRDVHGTCSLMAGRADVHAERAATFGV
jgi:hypothetical protein